MTKYPPFPLWPSSSRSDGHTRVRWGRHIALFWGILSPVGCESNSQPTQAPRARFEAVTAKEKVSRDDLSGFCDLQSGKPVTLPTTKEPLVSPAGPRWVNVWATWCKSCIEEVPLIETWRGEYGFSVAYISADEAPGALDDFRNKHPQFPASAQMKEPEQVADFITQLGLDEGAGLPLHLFLSPDGELRCARAAAISAHHLPLIRELLK